MQMKLSLQNVTKIYSNGVKAIDQISFDISPGMVGLLGPNGAGKSSLMRTIATLQFPDSGKLLFNDQDIFSNKTAFRKQLGIPPPGIRGLSERIRTWTIELFRYTQRCFFQKRKKYHGR